MRIISFFLFLMFLQVQQLCLIVSSLLTPPVDFYRRNYITATSFTLFLRSHYELEAKKIGYWLAAQQFNEQCR